jgi:hypothetical protein
MKIFSLYREEGVVLFIYPYEVVDGVRFEEWGPRGLLIREAVYPPYRFSYCLF